MFRDCLKFFTNSMETTNDYNDLLSCAICFSNMSDTINVCVMGHSVCGDCHSNCQFCPYCRKPWSRTRNRNLEQLVTSFPKSSELIHNEHLKCPKCRCLMENDIYLCGDGHSICSDCVKGIYQCLVCPKLICYRRNFTLEKLIDNVKTMEVNDDGFKKVKAFFKNLKRRLLWVLAILRYTLYLPAT